MLAHDRCIHILCDSNMIYSQDLSTSEVLYDEAFKSLEIAMKGLVQPVSDDTGTVNFISEKIHLESL